MSEVPLYAKKGLLRRGLLQVPRADATGVETVSEVQGAFGGQRSRPSSQTTTVNIPQQHLPSARMTTLVI